MSGEIGFSQTGDASQPSPSIWGDCPNTLLQDKGLGYYGHAEFLGGGEIPAGTTVTAAMVAALSWGPVGLALDTDLDDVVITHKAAEQGGYLDLQTGASDNDAVALIAEPFGKIVRNSGNKLWFEARVELGALADQGFFCGLVEEANQTVDVIAANAGALISTDSFIGFQVLNDDTDGLDAVYQKDGGTPVTVKSVAGTVAANTEVKIGLRFTGRDKLYFYVDGALVATQTVDSTLDQSHDWCPFIGLKTGTAAAQSIAVDWVRFAYQARA